MLQFASKVQLPMNLLVSNSRFQRKVHQPCLANARILQTHEGSLSQKNHMHVLPACKIVGSQEDLRSNATNGWIAVSMVELRVLCQNGSCVCCATRNNAKQMGHNNAWHVSAYWLVACRAIYWQFDKVLRKSSEAALAPAEAFIDQTPLCLKAVKVTASATRRMPDRLKAMDIFSAGLREVVSLTCACLCPRIPGNPRKDALDVMSQQADIIHQQQSLELPGCKHHHIAALKKAAIPGSGR